MAVALGHYDQLAAGSIAPLKLLTQITCPHCWERFPPEQVLWVSEHIDLLGDPLLGPRVSSGSCRAGTRSRATRSTPRG